MNLTEREREVLSYLALGVVGLVGLVALSMALQVGTARADDPVSPTFALTPASGTVIYEGRSLTFTVTGVGLGADPVELRYSVGPDSDAGTDDVTPADFSSVSPGGRLPGTDFVGTLTFTESAPSQTIVVAALGGDGTDLRIRETFVVRVTGDNVDLSSSAVINEGVCHRSIAVCTWIVDSVNAMLGPNSELECTEITNSHLDALMAAEPVIRMPLAAPTELYSNDFSGMESVQRNNIRNNRLRSLPEELFAGLYNLKQILLNNVTHAPHHVNQPGFLSVRMVQEAGLTSGDAANTVRLEVVEHAPFAIDATISVVSGRSFVVDGVSVAQGERVYLAW